MKAQRIAEEEAQQKAAESAEQPISIELKQTGVPNALGLRGGVEIQAVAEMSPSESTPAPCKPTLTSARRGEHMRRTQRVPRMADPLASSQFAYFAGALGVSSALTSAGAGAGSFFTGTGLAPYGRSISRSERDLVEV